MRVTQSMLSSNLLRNLNTSYTKMSKLQEQIESGSIISRPSDDPVVAVKGMGYRVDIDKIEQYQRNIGEVNTWIDTTDDALDQVGTSLIRVQELVTQAANDSNTDDERKKIEAEIDQIQQQIRDIANTKVGENYIFSGTNTNTPLYTDTKAGTMQTGTGLAETITINVFDGVTMQVNIEGEDFFSKIDTMMTDVSNALKKTDSSGQEIGDLLNRIQGQSNVVLEQRAVVGARQNRAELMANRLSMQEINVTKQMSNNEDTDYSKAITEMTTAESIHQASLSVGAKIIQQTLVDFIR
ncbi:flagellar hook-associated protein FlgL [Lysinibacillus sp. 2017]|uniref:flagellar hook-associated protein FlgL n=1 Tax=unclassified Lysinibacillus TaxID=2636778 RepID=UPI000D52798D|nr:MULTISPECIES: flagellar hook-associated protein FlgL [unclassified Lysinibacillus]AWE06383.1 flagellar hook-associated protein FlgL [Lysinibacillus sp. 2017]TGN33389.1 flagellar hook-associated protein FlgL [Lysinibacillus sp. S2017]